MYGVNDVFDYASDLRNLCSSGIEGGLVAPERARAVHRRILWASALSVVPFVVYLVAVGSVASTVVLAVVLFLVVAYSAPVLYSRMAVPRLVHVRATCRPLFYAPSCRSRT